MGWVLRSQNIHVAGTNGRQRREAGILGTGVGGDSREVADCGSHVLSWGRTQRARLGVATVQGG